jgi:iron complex transport system substrate-binding protein
MIRREAPDLATGTRIEDSTRRGLISSALLAAFLIACRSRDDDAATTPEATGPWEFTDDHGVNVSLPSRPQRIVAFAGAAAVLWDYGIRTQIVGLFGPQRRGDGSKDPQLGNVDPAGMQSIGQAQGEFDLEKLAALRPDLIVTFMWDPQFGLWFVPQDAASRVEQIAPSIGIRIDGGSVTRPLSRFEALAAALGADLTSPEVAGGKESFDKAGADLRGAIAEKPGLKVTAIGGRAQTLAIAKPSGYSDLTYLRELGMDLVEPGGSDPYWEFLSWEQAAKCPADLILTDSRSSSLSQEQLAQIPTWSQLPAVKAGQMGTWQLEPVYSYQGFATVLDDLTATIRKAKADVV